MDTDLGTATIHTAARAPRPGRFRLVTAEALDQAQFDALIERHERALRGRPGGRRLDLRLAQLDRLSMAWRDLSEAKLVGASLRGVQLGGACLNAAELYCADLTGVAAEGTDFTRADLRGACLRGARLDGAQLSGADLRPGALAVADAERGFARLQPGGAPANDPPDPQHPADLRDALMVRVRLRGAHLRHADLRGAVLTDASLAGARLEGARLEGAVLSGVDLARSGLTAEQLAGAVLDPTLDARARAGWLRDQLERAEQWWRSGARNAGPAVLDGEDLRVLEGGLAYRRLTGMSASGAMAVGVDFSHALLQGAVFDGADLRCARFDGADLRGASFRGANLHHVSFTKAELGALPVGPGRTWPVDFTDARTSALVWANDRP